MPPALPDNFIVISDDEEDTSDDQQIEHLRTVRFRDPVPSTSPIRSDLEGSPVWRRNSKRQKMLDGSTSLPMRASSPEAAGPSGFTRAQLNFDNDGQFTQAYPDFFLGAFPEDDALSFSSNVAAGDRDKPIPKKKAVTQPPYFDDPKLHIRMFRGPGCEHFPLPVDANPKFKEICDTFDEKVRQKEQRKRAKRIRYNEFGSYVDETIEVETSDEEDEASPMTTPGNDTEATCLAQILEVLPDVAHEFVLEKIRAQHESWRFGGEEIEVLPDTSAVIAELLEMEAYPKEKKQQETERDPFEDDTDKTIKWNRIHQNHGNYHKDAIILLASQYDYVPTHYISKIVKEKRTIWEAYLHIEEVDTTYFQRSYKPYARSRRPRVQVEKKYQRSDPYHDPEYYPSLVSELQAVRQHLAREFLRKSADQAKIDAEKANLEEQKKHGLIVECQCCFDEEVPMNRAVSCVAATGEHSFCYNCVESLANSQIGLAKHEMKCMDGSGCQEKLDMDGVGKAVPIKTFDRLLFNEQQNEIAAANIEGLEQCPFCDFKAICEPIEEDPVFSCQNPDCFRVTCRKCHENSHLPKTCEEIKKDRGLDARHKIEEARSEAMMRPCPQCKKMLIKSEGCNKVRCTCGAIICYVCKLDLSKLRDGYDHFNKGERRCPLYETPGIERHDQDADEAERKAIEKAKAEDDSIDETVLQIESGKGKATARAAVAPNLPGPQPPAPRRRVRAHAYRDRLDAMREQLREQRRYAAVVPIMGVAPPEYGMNNAGPAAPQQRRAMMGNPVVAAAAAPILANNAGIGYGVPGQLPNLARDPNAMPQQWRQAGGDIFRDIWQRRIAQLDDGVGAAANNNADEQDMLDTGNRIHNYRADMARRRETQLQRRNTVQNNAHQPLQFPNPAFLNLKNPLQRQAVFADQGQPQGMDQQAQRPQVQNNGAWLPEIPHHDGLFDHFDFDDDFGDPGDWLGDFQPAAPLPANTGVMDRGRPFRRQTMPDHAFNVGGNQQNNRVEGAAAPPQNQQQAPYGWF
ncbi:hypothetical protein PMZ80_008700 [Knufia obscura]|uniref:RING-type domain-containing protein n=1 Tax=Knufia obscura TaxID=1635080 RepID=A0ABR0RFK1_9EURO|nr:hypothetical protein PMZ80_008700 [Knufia obscura]